MAKFNQLTSVPFKGLTNNSVNDKRDNLRHLHDTFRSSRLSPATPNVTARLSSDSACICTTPKRLTVGVRPGSNDCRSVSHMPSAPPYQTANIERESGYILRRRSVNRLISRTGGRRRRWTSNETKRHCSSPATCSTAQSVYQQRHWAPDSAPCIDIQTPTRRRPFANCLQQHFANFPLSSRILDSRARELTFWSRSVSFTFTLAGSSPLLSVAFIPSNSLAYFPLKNAKLCAANFRQLSHEFFFS